MASAPCVFCEIIRGDARASIVFSDERCVAFMDIRPVNPGHVLVVPRNHASLLGDVDTETGGHLFRVAMRIARAVRQTAVRCEGVNLFVADGPAAGQEVPHLHLHVVPRFWGDGFGFRVGPGNFQRPERAVLDAVGAGIRAALEE